MIPKKSTARKGGMKRTQNKRSDEMLLAYIIMAVLFIFGCALVVRFMPAGSTRMTNVASRLATIESLVHRGTFFIEESQFFTIDKYLLDEEGHWLSMKPPVLPTIAAGYYWLYRETTGNSFGGSGNPYYWITYFVGFLPHLLLLIFFYKFLLLIVKHPLARVLTYSAITLSYLGILYARSINNHTVAACFLFIAFYYAFLIRNKHTDRKRDWIIAGLFTGFFPTIDLPSAVFAVAIFLYLLSFDYRKTLMFFLPGAFPPLFLHFFLMQISAGSLSPIQLGQKGLPPSPHRFEYRDLKVPLDRNTWSFFWNMTFGHHGFFAHTPVLLLGVIETVRQVLFRKTYWREGLVIFVPLIILMLFYTFRIGNYAGVAVGFRWLIPPMPLLILFAGVLLDRALSRRNLALFLIFLVFIAFGARQLNRDGRPWMRSRWTMLYTDHGMKAYPIILKQTANRYLPPKMRLK